MAGRAADPTKRRRLIELPARTGMRAGELGALEADAMVTMDNTHRLPIRALGQGSPIAKSHRDT